jgi:5,6-dimethylbenzimidazole synthase
MHFTPSHAETLRQIMRWRRDVRHFKTLPIDAAVLARIEAAVDLAPSVGNARPWRMVRVRDAGRRQQIITQFEAANLVASARYRDGQLDEYLGLKLAGLREAPVHIAVFTEQDPAAGHGLGRQTMPETLALSTATAIHTLWLAATAENLGVGWVSILDPETATATLNVPPTWHLTAYLCVGHPIEPSTIPELHRVGWQANTPTLWCDR